MNLQEILKTVNENTLAVAKALQEGDTDQAVDLLTKHAEAITQRIEKSQDTPNPDDKEPELPEETPPSPKEDTPPSETPPTEPVEKKETISLTKQQHIVLTKAMDIGDEGRAVLKKFVEMYISASDVPDFVTQFEEIKERLSKVESSSQQLPEGTPIKKSSLEGILSVK